MERAAGLLRSEVPEAWKRRVVAGTGHRPGKLLGYGRREESLLDRFACAWIETLEPLRVLTGMAQGYDLALARASARMGIPFVAAVPFEGQEALWPDTSRREYQAVLSQASTVVVVTPGGYSRAKLAQRNEWLVDNAELLMALLRPHAGGGTANCVRYAAATGRDTIHLWRSWETFLAHVGRYASARQRPEYAEPLEG